MSDLKVITLWQPWASLIGHGIKRIETRGWSTKYRGRLAIHAAARPPCGHRTDTWVGNWRAYRRSGDGGYDLTEFQSRRPEPDVRWRGALQAIELPLGAVVATCTLVDVVPMVGADGCKNETRHLCIVNQSMLLHSQIDEPWPDGETEHIVSDQLPYGDFRPGRFAWLLDDIKPVDPPVPARGRQGLWTPDADLVEALAA